MNVVGLEKLRDLDVVTVLFAFEIVFHQNERLFGRAANPVKFPVRTTLLDRRNFYFIDIESRKVSSRLAKKDFCFHYQMSMFRCGPLTVFWARTIQPISSLLEAICAPGHKIVSSSKTPLPTRQSFPTTEPPRICALESTVALGWIGAHQSGALTCAGRQPSFETTRCTSKYSAREPRLNHLPCSRTTPPIFPPWAIQSPRIGMNDIFCFDGIRAKTDGLHTAMLAKSYSPGTP